MAEKAELLASLNEQRNALVEKFEMLSDPEATEVVVPSGWCALDLAHHIRRMEEYWIVAIAHGDDVDFDLDDILGAWAWATPNDLTVATTIANYRAPCQCSDDFILGAASLDIAPVRQPVWEMLFHWSQSLRAVILHLIDETARHTGHMDLVCELLLADRTL